MKFKNGDLCLYSKSYPFNYKLAKICLVVYVNENTTTVMTNKHLITIARTFLKKIQ